MELVISYIIKSSLVNTELKYLFMSSAIKKPCDIIFPTLSPSSPLLTSYICIKTLAVIFDVNFFADSFFLIK